MIVLDASVVVEAITGGPRSDSILEALTHEAGSALAPHLLDIEVLSALRRMTAGGRLDVNRGEQLIADLAALPVQRCPHEPILLRIWELRSNFTAYDAAYIALAEAFDAVLLTADEKLAAAGHRAKVRVLR